MIWGFLSAAIIECIRRAETFSKGVESGSNDVHIYFES